MPTRPKAKKKAAPRPRGIDPATVQRVYDADEAEFIAAMESYKKANRRPFPAWSEALLVLKSLGYRKG